MFEEFINYYHKFEINQIDESMITAFLRYLVIERKVSISYQNQAINAVKFYYERVLGCQRKVYMVDRPRYEKRLQIRVQQAKGKKDRYTLLSKKLLETPREYFKAYKPKEFLFEGVGGGVYSQRSIQSIMKRSVAKAGIKK
jgi:integrase/recombinase XerD